MPPPPEAVYTDLPTAIASIQAHAKANGYALYKRDTKPKRVVMTCDRFGKVEATREANTVHSSKQRKGSRSKKCDCKMKVFIQRDEQSGQWELKVYEGSHNHGPSADISAHPQYRIAALDPEVHDQINNLVLSGLNNA